MSLSPAEIIRAALVTRALGKLPSSGAGVEWPVYVGSMPATPDNAICIYDLEGDVDGRIMRTGETIIHPGYQVRVRGTTHPIGYSKAKDIQRALDAFRNFGVAVGAAAYIIQSIKQSSGILSLGEEPEVQRRNGFTLNGTITYKEVTT